MRNTSWTDDANCLKQNPDDLFVVGKLQHSAKRICDPCPVKLQCLAEALDGSHAFGVWGGMTERERRALLLRRPDVVSWRNLLETAQADRRTA